MKWQSVCRPVGDDRTNDPRSNTSNHSRREFLANLAAFGLAAVTPARRLIAQTAEVGAKPGRIDFHHHAVPPFYLAENRDRIVAAGGGRINPSYLSWTPEQALASMDKNGVATAVLSLSPGGFWFGDRQAAEKSAIRLKYRQGVNVEEIAREFRITKGHVGQLCREERKRKRTQQETASEQTSIILDEDPF